MSLATKIRGLREIWAFDNRLWLTFTKSLFRREHLHVYRYRGLDILVDHASGDANGAREVLTSQMYTQFFSKMDLKRPLNILDIGGSNGGFPLLLAAHGFQLDKVVSVELNPRTYVRLHFNLHRNLDCEVIAINAAVCGESQKLKVKLGPGGVSDSIIPDKSVKNAKEYEIDGVTLDEIYGRYFSGRIIDICKLDVEGAEFEILSTPTHDRLAQCRYLIMEIHGAEGRHPDKIIRIVENLGFELTSRDTESFPDVYLFRNTKFVTPQ